VRSLRQGTQAQAVRYARTCYDHLAGMVGTELMSALLEQDLLAGGDGVFEPGSNGADRLSSPGFEVDYRLTERGVVRMREFGIDFETLPPRRPLIRYCVDWSEQRHHLAGSLGAALATRMFELGWLTRARNSRAVHVSEDGRDGLKQSFGVELIER
jgi:hypothetical protein